MKIRAALMCVVLAGLPMPTVSAQEPSTETSGEGPGTANGAWTLRSFPPVAFPKSKVPEAQAAADQAVQAMNQGRLNETLALLEKAIQLDPVHPFAYWRLGTIQLGPGPRETGLANMRKQLEVAPSAQAYVHTAFILQASNYLDESIRVWREGVTRYPADRNMAALFGETLMRANLLDEAVAVLSAESIKRPQSSRLHIALARALSRRGKAEEAGAHVQRAVELEGSPAMLMTAAATLVTLGADLDRALGYARQAVSDTEKATLSFELPRDARVGLTPASELFLAWDTLSSVYARRGQVEEAHAWGFAAWRLSPNAATAIRLGRLLQDRADFPGAARDYAFGAFLSGPEAAEARDRLTAIASSPDEVTRLIEDARAANRTRTTFTWTRQTGPAWRGNVVMLVDRTGVVTSVAVNPPPPEGVEAALKTWKVPALAPPDSSLPRLVVSAAVTCAANASTCSATIGSALRTTLFGVN